MKITTAMEFDGRSLSVELEEADARMHYESKGQAEVWDGLAVAHRHAVMMALADLMLLDYAAEDALLDADFVAARKRAVGERMKRQLRR